MESPIQPIKAIVQQAGKLLLEYFAHTDLEASYKADHTLVTEADLAADELISNAIRKQFPGDSILSEEIEESHLRLAAGGAPIWVVDPLDGTTNFSLGLHFWGILVARLVDGKPESAVLHFPLLHETYTAQHSQGAYLNGVPIHVSAPDPSRPSAFFTCCSRTYRRYKVSVPYKARILGSAGYSFCSVARGMALVGFEATPKIWDIAAGWLLVEEAGGVVRSYGKDHPFPLHPELDYGKKSFPTLIAASEQLAERTIQQILPREKEPK